VHVASGALCWPPAVKEPPMICWSCQKNVEAAEFCSGCSAILPFEGRPDRFSLLGAPKRFSQDLEALERRYKEATRAVHPDKFARADTQAKRISSQRTVALNEAWRTLRDPVARAEYLLGLLGIDLGAEAEDRTLRTTGPGQKKIPVPAGLLNEMIEKQEALMEARFAEDETTVLKLGAEVRASQTAAMEQAVSALDSQGAGDAERAAQSLVAVRYYKRFLESIDHGGDQSPGVNHG
jgi:molecular chaperone HscB